MSNSPLASTRPAAKASHGRHRRARHLLLGGLAGVALALGGAVLLFRDTGSPTTAFASAPAGSYAVIALPAEDADAIAVVSTAGGDPLPVLEVPHLPGFASRGAVAPDGTTVALVVADGGTPTHPLGSLLVADLNSGQAHRLVTGIDVLQEPVWDADGTEVAVTRGSGDGESAQQVTVVRVSVDGAASPREWSPGRALGVYPVGYGRDGALYAVVIGGDGSTLYRDGEAVTVLAPGITRDWELSPDRTRLAFIEVTTAGGVAYAARSIDLGGTSAGSVTAQALALPGQQLGVAWRPGDATATYGADPASNGGGVQAQALSAGFLVPLSYSPDGVTLAAEAWSGGSFAAPGTRSLALVGDSGRVALPAAARFIGWAAR